MRRAVLMAGLLCLLACSPLFANESLELILTIPMPRDSVRVSSITPIGDFNSDGYGDLAVGVTGIGDRPILEAVYLYYGGPSFDSIADLCFLGDTQSVYVCNNTKTFFGEEVTPLGDFNGDGFDDLAISASHLCSYINKNGRIYIYFGGHNPDITADLEIDGRRDYDCMGSLLASGDFNGDGLGDLIAHAGDEYYGERMSIFLGHDPPDTSVDWVYNLPRDEIPTFYVYTGFDPNGDGYGDFAWRRSLSANNFYFFLGGDTLSHQPALVSSQYYNFFNFDLSGDGIDDFWGGVNGTSYLYLGGDPLDFEPDYLLGRLGAWPSIYRRINETDMFMVDDTRVTDNHRFIFYNIGMPPDTIPAYHIYYGPMRYPSAPNIGDINGDGSDELALGTNADSSIQEIKIYNIATTGIDDDNGGGNLPRNISLSAYPNPFNSRTTITLSGIPEAEIAIYDITGRRLALLLAKSGRAEWEAEDVPSGVYLARVVGEMGGGALRLVVVR